MLILAELFYRTMETISTENLRSKIREVPVNTGEYAFSGCVRQTSALASLLRCLSFSADVNVSLDSSEPRRLRFTGEEGKYVQASVLIHPDIFHDLMVSEEHPDLLFKIFTKDLLGMIKLLVSGGDGSDSHTGVSTDESSTSSSTKSTLTLIYESWGHPFKILLDDKGVKTDVEIRTCPYDEGFMQVEMEEESEICKIIVKSEEFSDLLAELESNNAETIRISIIPDQEMKLSCDGITGIMTCSIPYDSEIIHGFDCTAECHVSYRFSILRYAMRTMTKSLKVALRIDSRGVLALTFLMTTKTESYVEFYFFPTTFEQEELNF